MSTTWWQKGVVYQIYPRSFLDTNGDGVGDLPGIRQRLGYLTGLGVDAVWISPIYPSPMADFGYDVSDYCDIDPLFGTMDDFDALLAEAHSHSLRVILDFVPNHTSDRHKWFLSSRAGRDSPYRDWYIWHDPAPDGGPPNNWISYFGGSAWEWDEATGQYYLHSFLKEQPELNWRNPDVRRAMYDVMRFWLARGVDGFRVDVIWVLLKDTQFRDNPPNPAWREGAPPHLQLARLHTADLPEVHDIIADMRCVCDEYGERVLIGEIYLPVEKLVAYYGRNGRGAHLPFNFQLIQTAWHACTIARLIDEYEAALPSGAWPNWVLGNHDKSRIASRVGAAQARVAAMLLLTLRGTPTLYYGDEIGMADVPVPPERVQDPAERNDPGHGLGRDPERTPMQWDESAGAGFTTGTPWLPLAADWQERNVVAQVRDPSSILALHRALLALRRAHPALSVGEFAPLPATGDLLAYRRTAGTERFEIVLNLGSVAAEFARPPELAVVRLSTHLDRTDEEVGAVLRLRADEGVLLELR